MPIKYSSIGHDKTFDLTSKSKLDLPQGIDTMLSIGLTCQEFDSTFYESHCIGLALSPREHKNRFALLFSTLYFVRLKTVYK